MANESNECDLNKTQLLKCYSILAVQEDGAAEAAVANEGGGDIWRTGAEGHQEALPRQAQVREGERETLQSLSSIQ